MSACLLAMVVAALGGCESWPEEGYEWPSIETRPAGPVTGTPRTAPAELGPVGEDEGEPVERVVQRGTGTRLSSPERRPQAAALTTDADGEITLNVVDGEVRVEIEGQEPFTARRGSLVNIPRQTIYSLETIGSTPSLRFTVNVAGAKTLYPQDVQPPAAAAGTAWTEVRINRNPGRYDEFNQPHLNVHEAAAKNDKYSGGRFVRDDKSEMLVLYGHEKNMPPLDPADKGHFHAESAEFWLVFSGRIRYAFEGQQPFVASEGDVVYVPSNTWHATRYIGDNACRLSITEYVGNALLLPH